MTGPLLQRVGELLDRGLEAGLQVPQDTGLLKIDPRALDAVVDLVDGTMDVLADVATACEQGLDLDEAEVTLPPQQLGDLAFVARSELEARGHRVCRVACRRFSPGGRTGGANWDLCWRRCWSRRR